MCKENPSLLENMAEWNNPNMFLPKVSELPTVDTSGKSVDKFDIIVL